MNAHVGQFQIENGALTGPTLYMHEQGNAKLDRILAGGDAGFQAMLLASPTTSLEQMICVALQTDYAGWRGMRQLQEGLQ